MSGESALVRGYPIERIGRDGRKSDVDRVTVEEPLEIRVGADTLAVTMRTPGNDFELSAGFLVAEGIVSRREEIVRIEHCREVRSPEEEGNVVVVRTTAPATRAIDRARRLLVTTSSCGLCGKGSIEALHGSFPSDLLRLTLDERQCSRRLPDRLRGAPGRLRRDAEAFTAPGSSRSPESRGPPRGHRPSQRRRQGRRDVLFSHGRLPLSEDSILLVSGRASFEIVQKALAAGSAVRRRGLGPVVSRDRPRARLRHHARRVSCARAGFNVYSTEDRLEPAPALDEAGDDPTQQDTGKAREARPRRETRARSPGRRGRSRGGAPLSAIRYPLSRSAPEQATLPQDEDQERQRPPRAGAASGALPRPPSCSTVSDSLHPFASTCSLRRARADGWQADS